MKKDERGEVRSILRGLISPLSFFSISLQIIILRSPQYT